MDLTLSNRHSVTYIHTDILVNHTGYDITNYFRSEATAKKKTFENAASDGFGQILVPRRFASPPIGGLLVFVMMFSSSQF